jgi:glucosamine--fructose-6-phosphate aminotransferase (isomerizing)
LSLEGLIEEKAQRYRYMEDGFVLARGINYPVALESALKIQETTYVRAKGYAISDFHHGPFAMVEQGTPVIIFAPEGPSLGDAKEMAEKLHGVEAEIILVTNAKREFEGLNAIVFEIPDASSDLISPFYNVVWAQLFACKLALAKGLNPDAPRGLKKVTITR